MHEFGIEATGLSLNWPAAVARARRIVAGCADPKPAHLTAHGAHLIFGSARFVDAHTVDVAGRHLRADQVLIATGLEPQRPTVPGVEHVLTHVEALQLEELPQRLAVIGGGVIAMEFAFLFARTGVQVVMLARRHVLARIDAELRDAITEQARQIGIDIRTETRVQAIVPEKDRYRLRLLTTPDTVSDEVVDQVLLAAGQIPAVGTLDLQLVGVDWTDGGVRTDSALRTSAPHIWAAGDVRADAPRLSQIASYEGRLAVRNALSGPVVDLDERIVPYLIGLTPPVAGVGLSEEEARAAGYRVGVRRQSYRDVCPAGNVVGEPDGFLKVIFDSDSGTLLGGHAFGAGAPELIQQIAMAMLGGLTLQQAGAALYPFPGLSEVVWYAMRPHPGDSSGRARIPAPTVSG